MDRVKTVYVLAAVMAVTVAAEGCKRRETKPAPQVAGTTLPEYSPPAGIAWFQGSLEEAFSRTTAQETLQPLTAAVDRRPGAGSWAVRMLSRLLQSARLGL